MQEHHDDWEHNAEHDFKNAIPSFLGSARSHDSAICIHDLGKTAKDTHQRTSDTYAACSQEFGMDIAKDVAIPPRSDVVCRPDKGIGEVKQIQN